MSKIIFLNGCGSRGKTSFEADRRILKFIDENPAPKAFKPLSGGAI